MKSQNGKDYSQNYDVIVKWMAETLCGETLDVIGIKTGRIKEVFAFEPVEIAVKAGRVDIMIRDETGAVFHIEEQRNLEKADMYRFASYHFQGAKQWPKLKDIILASGRVYKGSKVIETGSGKYEPIVIDFTQQDGHKRLEEIREAVSAGTFDNWLELVFLPLYGKETGKERSQMAEKILRFENELYQADKIPVRLLAATLILSNKMIEKDRLKALWEEIKMLDIFEIAKEEGKKEGKEEGKREGEKKGKILGTLETAREMVMNALLERFNVESFRVSEQIKSLQNPDIIKALLNQAIRCQDIKEFEAVLEKVS